jgi:hypothetical protein
MIAIETAGLAEEPVAAPGSPTVIAGADESLLGFDAKVISALLTEVFAANDAAPAPRTAKRFDRRFDRGVNERFPATTAITQVIRIL